MSENIRVVIRFRPINAREKKEQQASGLQDKPIKITTHSNSDQIQICPQTSNDAINFSFDKILMNCTQEDAFDAVALKICSEALLGYNGTIFAYGQTGSGKTFSMLGDEEDQSHPEKMGIIPRSVSYIFNEIEENNSIKEASVKVSFCEIYKEQLRDLLDPSKKNLKIQLQKNGDTKITNLTEKTVLDLLDILKLLEIASSYRARAETNMNHTSSRSHMLMTLLLSIKMDDNTIRIGKINFADLAGSEKVRKTGVTGKRLKEAQKINLSLTMLGQTISFLAEGRKHIPYRDSLLTHILKDSLGGNCKTCLLLCASSHIFNRDESINSLRFGSRCKLIENNAEINKIYTNEELLEIVKKLKAENRKLAKSKKGGKKMRAKSELSVETSESKIYALEKKNLELETKRHEAMVQKEETEKELMEMKNNLENTKKIYNDTMIKLNVLESENKQFKTLIKNLESQLDDQKKNEVEQQLQNISSKKYDNVNWKEKYTKIESKNNHLEMKLEVTQNKLLEKQNEIEKLKEELENRTSAYQEKNYILKKQYDDANDEITRTRSATYSTGYNDSESEDDDVILKFKTIDISENPATQQSFEIKRSATIAHEHKPVPYRRASKVIDREHRRVASVVGLKDFFSEDDKLRKRQQYLMKMAKKSRKRIRIDFDRMRKEQLEKRKKRNRLSRIDDEAESETTTLVKKNENKQSCSLFQSCYKLF